MSDQKQGAAATLPKQAASCCTAAHLQPLDLVHALALQSIFQLRHFTQHQPVPAAAALLKYATERNRCWAGQDRSFISSSSAFVLCLCLSAVVAASRTALRAASASMASLCGDYSKCNTHASCALYLHAASCFANSSCCPLRSLSNAPSSSRIYRHVTSHSYQRLRIAKRLPAARSGGVRFLRPRGGKRREIPVPAGAAASRPQNPGAASFACLFPEGNKEE